MKEIIIKGKKYKLKDDFTAQEIIKTDAIISDSIYNIMKSGKHKELLETLLEPVEHNEPNYEEAGIKIVGEVIKDFFYVTQIELNRDIVQSLANSQN